jgi:hypothetical protein
VAHRQLHGMYAKDIYRPNVGSRMVIVCAEMAAATTDACRRGWHQETTSLSTTVAAATATAIAAATTITTSTTTTTTAAPAGTAATRTKTKTTKTTHRTAVVAEASVQLAKAGR